MTLDKVDEVESKVKKVENKIPTNTASKEYVDNAVANVKVTTDSALSTTSTNAVQNKVVTEALNKKIDTAVVERLYLPLFYSGGNPTEKNKQINRYALEAWAGNPITHFRCVMGDDELGELMPVTSFESDGEGGLKAYVMVNGTDNTSSKQIKIHFKADGSAEKIGEVTSPSALQYSYERVVYAPYLYMGGTLPEEFKAYNAETYRLSQIEDQPVSFTVWGLWGYIKEGTFGNPNGYMVVGFIKGDTKGGLIEISVRINADGDAYVTSTDPIADSTLSATSTNPIQNKAVYAALEEIRTSGGGASLENIEFVNVYLPDALAQIMANEEPFSDAVAEMLVGALEEYGEAETATKAQSAYAEMFQKNTEAYNKIQENISKKKDTIVVVNSSLTISAYNDSPLFSEFVGSSYYGTEFTALGVIEWNNVIGEASGIPFYIRFEQEFESKRIYLDEQGCIHYDNDYRLLYFPLADGELSEEQNESNAKVLMSLFARVLKPTDVKIRGVDTMSRECILVESYLDMLLNQCVVHCFTQTGTLYKATITLNEDGTSSASGVIMFNA